MDFLAALAAPSEHAPYADNRDAVLESIQQPEMRIGSGLGINRSDGIVPWCKPTFVPFSAMSSKGSLRVGMLAGACFSIGHQPLEVGLCLKGACITSHPRPAGLVFCQAGFPERPSGFLIASCDVLSYSQ
jgi:hypothetical protein